MHYIRDLDEKREYRNGSSGMHCVRENCSEGGNIDKQTEWVYTGLAYLATTDSMNTTDMIVNTGTHSLQETTVLLAMNLNYIVLVSNTGSIMCACRCK